MSKQKGFNKQNERITDDIISKRRTFAAVKRSKRIAKSPNNKQYGTENQVYEDAWLRQRLHLY